MDPDNAQHFSLNLASAVDKVYQRNILKGTATLLITMFYMKDINNHDF